MTYLQIHHRRPDQKRRMVATIVVIAIVVAFGLVQLFAPRFLPGLFTAVAAPFWRAEFSVGRGSLRSEERLLLDNERLKLLLDEASIRLETISAIEDENTELKELLGRRSSNDATTTPDDGNLWFARGARTLAAVLKRPPVSPYDDLIVDAGIEQSISTSSSVYAPGNVLIGRVTSVLGSTSIVRLFSSPDETHEVLIGPSHVPAQAVGRGGGQYAAQVSRDVEIGEGDFVANPSLSDRPFGIVSAVLSDPTQPFMTVLFAPPVNVYDIKWVLIDRRQN